MMMIETILIITIYYYLIKLQMTSHTFLPLMDSLSFCV